MKKQDPAIRAERTLPDSLFEVALLAGLGSEALAAVDELLALGIDGVVPAGGLRSCADAGSPLLVGMRAPGPKSFSVSARLQRPDEATGVQRWLRWAKSSSDGRAEGDLHHTVERVFLDAPAVAWQSVRGFVDSADHDAGAELDRLHGRIGPWGKLFSLSSRPDGAAPRVSWLLHRTSDLRSALRDAGRDDVFDATRQRLAGLFNAGVLPKSGPWRVDVPIADSGAPWIVATTAWARVPESPAKQAQVAVAVAESRGDRAFAQALYSVLSGRGAAARSPAVGRALEVAVDGEGNVTRFEALLRADTPG